jgi:hypothetical protein
MPVLDPCFGLCLPCMRLSRVRGGIHGQWLSRMPSMERCTWTLHAWPCGLAPWRVMTAGCAAVTTGLVPTLAPAPSSGSGAPCTRPWIDVVPCPPQGTLQTLWWRCPSPPLCLLSCGCAAAWPSFLPSMSDDLIFAPLWFPTPLAPSSVCEMWRNLGSGWGLNPLACTSPWVRGCFGMSARRCYTLRAPVASAGTTLEQGKF